MLCILTYERKGKSCNTVVIKVSGKSSFILEKESHSYSVAS